MNAARACSARGLATSGGGLTWVRRRRTACRGGRHAVGRLGGGAERWWGWFAAFALLGGAVHEVVVGYRGEFLPHDLEGTPCRVDGGVEDLVDVGAPIGDAIVVEVVEDVEVHSQIGEQG